MTMDYTTKQSHPAAAILREITDEAAVNPEPHLAFEILAIDGSSQEWHTPGDLRDLVDLACREGWQVRRKPKTVCAEGEVSEDAIEKARQIINPDMEMVSARRAEEVARALLSLVESE